MDLDSLKAAAGKYGKVSRKGLYSGLGIGRFVGGYTGLEIGRDLNPEADLVELYPVLDAGQLGPEEAAVYSAVVAGYFAGGFGMAKAVTRYQEMREEDLEYTRPFLKPFEGLKAAKEFLEEDVTDMDERAAEGLTRILEDEE